MILKAKVVVAKFQTKDISYARLQLKGQKSFKGTPTFKLIDILDDGELSIGDTVQMEVTRVPLITDAVTGEEYTREQWETLSASKGEKAEVLFDLPPHVGSKVRFPDGVIVTHPGDNDPMLPSGAHIVG